MPHAESAYIEKQRKPASFLKPKNNRADNKKKQWDDRRPPNTTLKEGFNKFNGIISGSLFISN